jgi:DNA primase
MSHGLDPKEEVRDRIDIVEFISGYVTLKKSGQSFKGLCPFHTDSTPSFHVRRDTGTWKCFGCGAGGDIFSFLQQAENLTFPEALEKLARLAGVPYEPRGGQQRASERERLRAAVKQAHVFYRECLARSPKAKGYLDERGVGSEAVEEFELGYAPARPALLLEYLKKHGVSFDDALAAGVLFCPEGRRDLVPWQRDRLVFPILNVHRDPIAFSGRALGGQEPRYINSPETPLFRKSKVLFGLAQARKAIAETDALILVEGNVDVVTLFQAGFHNVAANLGTALTEEHVRLIARYTKQVILAYDADSGGVKAALRASDMFEGADLTARVAALPNGEDPDSMVRNHGPEKLREVLDSALGIVDYKLKILLDSSDLSTEHGRSVMVQRAIPILAAVRNGVERDRHIRFVADRWRAREGPRAFDEEAIRLEIKRYRSSGQRRRQEAPPATRRTGPSSSERRTRVEMAERGLVACLFAELPLAKIVVEETPTDALPSPWVAEVIGWAREIISAGGAADPKTAIQAFEHTDWGPTLVELVTRPIEPPPTARFARDCIRTVCEQHRRTTRRKMAESVIPRIDDGRLTREDEEFKAFWAVVSAPRERPGDT